jgi:hypothetical protein
MIDILTNIFLGLVLILGIFVAGSIIINVIINIIVSFID